MFAKILGRWWKGDAPKRRRSPARRATGPVRSRPQLEPLETRLVPAAMVVDGTDAANTITLTQDDDDGEVHVTVATAGVTVDNLIPADVTELTINAKAGNDVIQVWVIPAGMSVTVNGEGDNDRINVGRYDGPDDPDNRSLSWILGTLTVSGGSGTTDRLFLDDRATSSEKTYTVSSTYVARSGAATISYDGSMERLRLYASSHSDQITVRRTSAITEIHAGNGNDAINVGVYVSPDPDGISRSLSYLDGDLYVRGEDGTDVLTFDDRATSGSWSYGLGALSLLRTGGVEVNYYTFESLVLHAGNNHNVLNLTGTLATTAVQVNAGAGSDGINLAPVPFPGPVTINGQDGTDTLNYSAYVGPITVNLRTGSATSVSGGVSNIENVTGGMGNDILVGDANSNTLLGNGGRDLLIGGPGADQLQGGEGEDILIAGITVHDEDAETLSLIRDVWSGPEPYAMRIALLYSMLDLLNEETVFDDGSPDVLVGDTALDWFFGRIPPDATPDILVIEDFVDV